MVAFNANKKATIWDFIFASKLFSGKSEKSINGY